MSSRVKTVKRNALVAPAGLCYNPPSRPKALKFLLRKFF